MFGEFVGVFKIHVRWLWSDMQWVLMPLHAHAQQGLATAWVQKGHLHHMLYQTRVRLGLNNGNILRCQPTRCRLQSPVVPAVHVVDGVKGCHVDPTAVDDNSHIIKRDGALCRDTQKHIQTLSAVWPDAGTAAPQPFDVALQAATGYLGAHNR